MTVHSWPFRDHVGCPLERYLNTFGSAHDLEPEPDDGLLRCGNPGHQPFDPRDDCFECLAEERDEADRALAALHADDSDDPPDDPPADDDPLHVARPRRRLA
jgi:hypothetical protein